MTFRDWADIRAEALIECEAFVADELASREAGFLPADDDDEDVRLYVLPARALLTKIRDALGKKP